MKKEQTPKYIIREAAAEDAIPTRKMQAKSWLATYPSEENGVPYEWVKSRTDSWMTQEKLEESKKIFAEVTLSSKQFYRIAEHDGKIVGFIHIATKDDTTKELEAIYTEPTTFSTGLGAKLMEAALPFIEGSDTGLTVASYNQRAIKFYEKYDFRKVEGSEHLYREKIPVIRMLRKGEKK